MGERPRIEDHQRHAAAIVAAVRRACDPREALRGAMGRSPNLGKPTGIIAAGKAAWAMVNAVEDLVGRPREFTVAEPAGSEALGMHVADHPIPTLRNLECAEVVQRR